MSEKFFQNKQAIIILIAASLVVLISMGIRQTWGLFYGFFETDLGFSRTQFGLAIAIQMVLWGSLVPIFGLLSDKFGPRRVVAFSFIIYLIGIYLLLQEPKTVFGFQISLGVLIGIALGGTAVSVPVSAVGKFFSNKNRTIATGLVTASASIGFFLMPIFVKFSNGSYGWKNTLEYFLYFLMFGLLCSLFMLKKEYTDETNNQFTRDQSATKALKEAFQHKGYKLLTAGFFVCGFQITLVATHIPGYIKLTTLPEWTATAILSLIGLFNIFGTLGMGYLSSKYSKKMLLSWLYFLRAIAILLFLLFPNSIYVALGFGVVFGILWLATIPPTNGIVAQVFGTKYLTTLFGIVFFSHQIGSFLGAYLGGYFFDKFGSYDYAWYLSFLLSIFAGFVHLPIDEKPIVRVAPVKA
jgi:MFS family permease